MEKISNLPVCTTHFFAFCHSRYLLLCRINDLKFFYLGIMNLSSSSSTTFGIPFRCNKPATQVIQALDDKPSFLSCRAQSNSFASSFDILQSYYIEEGGLNRMCGLVSEYVCKLRFCCFMKSLMNIRTNSNSSL